MSKSRNGVASNDNSFEKSPSTEPTSLENLVAELKIEDKSEKLEDTKNEEGEAEPVDNRTIEEIENDIYSAKVIACAIDNPESCTMCSG